MNIRKPRRLTAYTALACALVLATLACPSAVAGFTAALTAGANSVSSGTQFVSNTDSNNNASCTSVPTGSVVPATSSFACTGAVWPAQVPGAATFTNTTTGTSAPLTKALEVTCLPVQLANLANAANPLLPRYALTSSTAGGPLATSSTVPSNLGQSGAITTDGYSAFAAQVLSAATPLTFTEAVWFKTTVGSGGLIGSSDVPSKESPNDYDRMLYFQSDGRLVMSVFAGGGLFARTPDTRFSDGVWHFAVGTVTNLSPGTDVKLYVDGVIQGSDHSNTNNQSPYTGYWRLGSLHDVPWGASVESFKGQLSNAFILPTSLTASAVSSLSSQTDQQSFSAAVLGLLPTNYWPLNDAGNQPYSGPLPAYHAVPCSGVAAQIGTATQCIFPAQASPCNSSSSVANLVTPALWAVPAGSLNTAQAITTTVVANPGSPDTDLGWHLIMTTTLVQKTFSQRFSWTSRLDQ